MQQPTTTITIEGRIAYAARLFDVTVAEIVGSSRQQHIVQARQALAYALRQTTPLSLKAIATHLGQHDHTSVAHAIGAAERRAVADVTYALRLVELVQGVPS